MSKYKMEKIRKQCLATIACGFSRVSEMRFELTQPNGHYPLKVACLPIPPPGQAFQTFVGNGAKNGTRTRDPDLGKVVLYQLSYFRIL